MTKIITDLSGYVHPAPSQSGLEVVIF
jgi:hypothetical protein